MIHFWNMYDYTEKSQDRKEDKVIFLVCVNLKTEVVFVFHFLYVFRRVNYKGAENDGI